VNFTFGIITTFGNESSLAKCIKSILSLEIKNFEIIVVGGDRESLDIFESSKSYIKHIKFDESLKKMWITKKKNIIIQEARHENIVFMHDYLLLDRNWYRGFVKFGNNFEVCTNIILNNDNTRFRDWTLSPNNYLKIDSKLNKSLSYLLPYSERDLTKYMYISGAYWVAKKEFMKKHTLNEKLTWGQGEDIEWSHRVRKKTKFQFNKDSKVYLQKQKDIYFTLAPKELLNDLKHKSFFSYQVDKLLIPLRRYKKKGKFFKYF